MSFINGSYFAISWSISEKIKINTSFTPPSSSAIYIEFVDNNSTVYAPIIINSTYGGAVGTYIQINADIYQSMTVNDFVDLSSYNTSTNGNLYCNIYQTGNDDTYSSQPIQVNKYRFSLQMTILESPPTATIATSGSYPP